MYQAGPDSRECTYTDAALERLWQLLPRLGHMAFVAEPGAHSRTSWRGTGQARLTPRRDGADWVTLEQGRFMPAGARQALTLSNTYRWHRAGPDHLSLYHERFGADAPVFLFDLVANGPHQIACRTAHHCGADDYHGVIRLRHDGFDFAWTISGPRKDEQLLYRYRMA